MNESPEKMKGENKAARRPLFSRSHEKRSLSRWVIPLVIILAVIYFLPRLMEMLTDQ